MSDLSRLIGALAFSVLALCAGCERPELPAGSMCTFNTDCADPLVCGLERCRRQCLDSRDCAAGLLCLSIGTLGGGCQLPEESACSLSSECTEGLVCRFATCTTECAEDRDCQSGAMCVHDEATEGDACVEPAKELCIYDSDCDVDLVCGPDQRCQRECVEDRDCVAPRVCVVRFCELLDGG